MRIAELVLEYIRVLSWPLVVVGLALFFRAPLRDFLSRLKSTSVMGVRLEADARRAEEETRPIADQPDAASPTPDEELWEQFAIAGARISILKEWGEFEAAVRDLAADAGVSRDARADTEVLLRELMDTGHVRESVASAARRIRAQVNVIAHDPTTVVSADAAASLMVAISRLTRAMVSDESYSG